MFSYFLTLLSFTSLIVAAPTDWTSKQWDVIVVGAGPAGIIAASRMAEAGLQTLLLEGGGPSYGVTGGDLNSRRPSWLANTDLTRVDVPGLYKSIFASPGSLTCGSLVNAFSGCTIGGNSAINAGLFFEPPSSDYDLYFPNGWKATDMAAATKRLYAKQPSTNITSTDGKRYLQTGYSAAKRWIVDAAGFNFVDINAKKDEKTAVFGHPEFDYKNGQRGGPAVSYLQTALKLSNFQLQSGTRVLRVERSGKTATGVTVLINNAEKVISLSTNGKVISSGGALFSPSLLMHSGIGNLTTLNRLQSAGKLSQNLKKSDWINLPAVGAGLFDNPNTFIELSSPSVQSYTYSYDNPPTGDKDLYLNHRSGPYTFASETAVFWDTSKSSDGRTVGFQGTIDSSGFSDFTNANTITLNIYGTSGLKSTGNVVLDNNFVPGPDSKVYYSNPADSLSIATFIHKLFSYLPKTDLKPLNIAQTASIDEIRRYITVPSAYARGQTNHWSSSCRIGSCVGTDTKVVGMDNIYVVDASVLMPLTVNPQFGVMVAAEKAAEVILKGMGKSIPA